jgi:uncharacterized protein with ATP-grasp and redox domains
LPQQYALSHADDLYTQSQLIARQKQEIETLKQQIKILKKRVDEEEMER